MPAIRGAADEGSQSQEGIQMTEAYR
jgi:hypothetical protein